MAVTQRIYISQTDPNTLIIETSGTMPDGKVKTNVNAQTKENLLAQKAKIEDMLAIFTAPAQ